MKKIAFTCDNGEKVDFFVVEQTIIGSIRYLLVTDGEEDDQEAEALILKDVSADTDQDACYVEVSNDDEYEAVARVFQEMLDDVDIKM